MMFQIKGVRVSLSFWFFALLACILLLDRERLLVYFIAPILVHECGHIAVILLGRVPVREIRLSPLGIAIRREPSVILSNPVEIFLSLGGILANLLAAAILYLFCFQSMRVMLLGASNIAVALYNALPIGDMDGGQVLRLLAARFFSPDTARTISLVCSLLILAPLFAFAVSLLISGHSNFTPLLLCGALIYNIIRNMDY
jgi:stage IV sporulation protein FB